VTAFTRTSQNIAPNDPHKEEKAKKLEAWRKETFKWMVHDLKEVVEYGKKAGIIIGIQNHGDFLKTANDVIEVITAVDSEWFGAIVDTGYYKTPDPYADFALVADHQRRQGP